MAPLSSVDRDEVWQAYMEEASSRFDEFGNFSKLELLTAVGDVDDWIDAGSKGQVKNCFSAPCDDELTIQQMDDIVNIVTKKRLEV
jgi:hypothetical protein